MRARAAIQIQQLRADEPPRDYAVERCVAAWHDLNTCRPIGMAVGAIPWTAIVEWTRFHGMEREVAEAVIYVIRRLDIERAERDASRRALENAGGAR